ncbi:cobalt-precorrin-6A reductase [Lichenibacterium dinghuense]|uniref:cobalt-precorrin-6A reductase n=1 Tax=Lichenibacterium dinghuense TaxID=2895977 RepID=UPI001F02D425|nr:cobalt-precorrin-6A reductase [Lichenibacterium sp. 6Y81]
MRLLILGGTTEASALARALAGRDGVAPVLSLAGRTRNPALPPIPHRIGGFGGAEGLADHLRRERVDAVVDATHPFAARISAHAVLASAAAGVPLLAFTRPSWRPRPGDRWTAVADLDAAAAALGPARTSALLTVGRLGLAHFRAAPQHRYVIRTIDPPDPAELPPDHALVFDRGPFALDGEIALMRREGVEAVVTKNSGGAAAAAKLDAARALGLRVIAVDRPRIAGERDEAETLDAVLHWIAVHRSGG